LDAARDCHPDEGFCRPVFHGLRDLFARLNNGHTEIVLPDELGLPPIDTRRVSDGVAVSWVDPDYRGGTCDLVEGTRILAVDGVEVHAAARRAAPWLIAHQSPAAREFSSYKSLLWGPPGTETVVSVEDGTQDSCTVILQREAEADLWHQQNDDDHEHRVASRVLGDSIGYLEIEGFGGSDFEERLHDAFNELMDTSGVVLDLRGNRGGQVAIAEKFAGRFFAEPTRLGDNCYRWCTGADCEIGCQERWLSSVEPVYEGDIAVLIDEDVASAAEVVAYALCRIGDARCFGRTTSGETEFVVLKEFPRAIVSVSSASFHPEVGQEIQGYGLVPDETIPLRSRDLRTNADRVLDTARSWLASGAPGQWMKQN
jgi:carboxyl-terminal processing protease